MPKIVDEDLLFRTTIRLFGEVGYEGMRSKEIARLAGVNEATLYRRFGTKSRLISAALSSALIESPFAKVAVTDNVGNDLMSIVTAYQDTFDLFGAPVIRLLLDLPRYPELQAAARVLVPNLLNAVSIIEAHQDDGSLMEGEPMDLLAGLLSPIMMRGIWNAVDLSLPAPSLAPERMVDDFLNGHRGTSSRLSNS